MTTTVAERYLIKDACPHCGKPVYADEGYYSTTGAHADCQSKLKREYEASVAKADAAFESIMGRRCKVVRTRRGSGGPTKKLLAKIQTTLEAHFDGATVTEAVIYLTSPVWCQARFDVRKFEGSAFVDGDKIAFGSWATVGELLKHHELEVTHDAKDWWYLEIDAKTATRRTPRGLIGKDIKEGS